MNDGFLKDADSQLAGWADPVRRLRDALDRNEFVLYCQPILALGGATRFPLGEALVRLREEEKSLLPPGDFLPVFEHYRMMPQLDRWVVRKAVQFLAHPGRLPSLTVNVSGQTLNDVSFARFVERELAEHRISPGSLLFEVDETDLLMHLDAAVRFSTAHKAIGVPMLVDGFGRRSASFASITRFKPLYVKIDGAITRKLLTSEVAKRKMGALLTISRALKLSLVAEFVEDQDVLMRLKALGVGYAQGFGIHEPLPLDRFMATEATNQCNA